MLLAIDLRMKRRKPSLNSSVSRLNESTKAMYSGINPEIMPSDKPLKSLNFLNYRIKLIVIKLSMILIISLDAISIIILRFALHLAASLKRIQPIIQDRGTWYITSIYGPNKLLKPGSFSIILIWKWWRAVFINNNSIWIGNVPRILQAFKELFVIVEFM